MNLDLQSAYEHSTELDRNAVIDSERAEGQRSQFVAARARDINAEILASDSELEGLMQHVFGDAEACNDSLWVRIYRESPTFTVLVERHALKQAELRADAEATAAEEGK